VDRAPPARGEAIAARLASLGRPAGLALLLAGTLLHARAGYFQDDLSGHARGSDDAYISYRYAHNLARGHGLVFNPGERVHTFTSPLGVLVPALCTALAGPHHEDAALWLFRLINVALLAPIVLQIAHLLLADALCIALVLLAASIGRTAESPNWEDARLVPDRVASRNA